MKPTLEIGSGANPWPQADILLDRYLVDPREQRSGEALHRDKRPLIIAAGENLPFKDKVARHCYSCHVIEHAVDLAGMLDEMSRVAESGFIDCPNPLLEAVLDQREHRWYITVRDGELIYFPKGTGASLSNTLSPIYFALLSDHYLIRRTWPLFVVRHAWTGSLRHRQAASLEEILPTPAECDRLAAIARSNRLGRLLGCLKEEIAESARKRIGRVVGGMAKRAVRSLRRLRRSRRAAPRFATLDELLGLMRCPTSRGGLVRADDRTLLSEDGRHRYPTDGNLVRFVED